MEELKNLLIKNEDDYFTLPHCGLIADWYQRYWQLHELVAKQIEYNDYYIPDNVERD